jgi:molybdenum cofactor guanylyltransferase
MPVYILAGGRSSRFGSDKARAELMGRPLIVRVAQAVEQFASRITVVADRQEKYQDLGLATIADLRPGLGPIAGLQTALHDVGDPGWILLASCDLLEVRPAWIQTLLSDCRPGADVVAFRGDRWEPLLALYHTDVLPVVDQQIDRRQWAMWRLIESARPIAAVLPADWPAVPQANTPQDLEAYQ